MANEEWKQYSFNELQAKAEQLERELAARTSERDNWKMLHDRLIDQYNYCLSHHKKRAE